MGYISINKDSVYTENITNKVSVINILDKVKENSNIVYHNKIRYYNIAISFDIETSSFINQGEKTGIMYIWMLNIDGYNIYGREWNDFYKLLDFIVMKFNTNINQRIVIYIHNLGYEHGFIYKHFNVIKYGIMKPHKPFNMLTDIGIEFRCSLFLSGYSLEIVGKNLKSHKSRKKVGKLNYNLIRHSKTPLSNSELDYCLSDVMVTTDFIKEKIEEYGNIAKIPNTKTGRVRRLFRKFIFSDRQIALKYRDLMQKLVFNDIYEYNIVKRAFMGGYVHCNPFYNSQIIDDITLKIDFTSSYPYVMVSENGYPMGKGSYLKNPKNIEEYIENYACIFTLIMTDVKCIFPNDNYISASKCMKLELDELPLNNGRVVDAKILSITITNIDYKIIKKCYSCKREYYVDFYYYPKGYLPRPFILCLLELYKSKTELKGVTGKEAEYLSSKEDTNSSYGMTVTDILRDIINFINGKWKSEKLTDKQRNEVIENYNSDKNRFLFYHWGVFITAFARKNLWTAILSVGNDHIYSDTDSETMRRPYRHISYIKKYNELVYKKLNLSAKHFNISMDYFEPKTIKGIKKPLGVWDIEDVCLRFKSLGAKRYLYEVPDTSNKYREKEYKKALNSLLTDNPNWFYFESFRMSGKRTKVKLTVSGVRKKEGAEYLDRDGHDKAFEYFSNETKIPAEYSGKSVLTYIDDVRDGEITDYLGNTSHYHEESCVHFDKSDYSFSSEDMYVEILLGLQKLS